MSTENMQKISQLIVEIESMIETILPDMRKSVGGNSSASKRARVATVALAKKMKKYREETVKKC